MNHRIDRSSTNITHPKNFFFFVMLVMKSFHLTGHLVDGLGESPDVARGDAGDGDTAVLGGVDGVLIRR